MSRKVTNITHAASRYDILSQTPGNYSQDNYFLKELQDKVNAEWAYRPNRANIEYEDEWGAQTYTPIEVVLQSVKTDKGEIASNNYKRIVFQDILEKRFNLGNRFRFGMLKNIDDPVVIDNSLKSVWMVTNADTGKMTSSVVVERCNGALNSVIIGDDGVSTVHREPVILSDDLSSTNFSYNEVAVSEKSQLLVTAQHNQFTKTYFINQRFVVGYDKVYKITAINKFDANYTFQPTDVQFIKIYLELTENSPYDDFKNYVAYQPNSDNIIIHKDQDSDYEIQFSSPNPMVSYLPSTYTLFTPKLVYNGVEVSGINFALTYDIDNLPSGISPSVCVDVQQSGNNFNIKRKQEFIGGKLQLTWSVPAAQSPTGSELSYSIELSLDRDS